MQKRKVEMPRYPIFKIIVAKQFFENYCPDISNVKHKLRGTDGNGNPIDFTTEDKKKIKAGVSQMTKDLKALKNISTV